MRATITMAITMTAMSMMGHTIAMRTTAIPAMVRMMAITMTANSHDGSHDGDHHDGDHNDDGPHDGIPPGP